MKVLIVEDSKLVNNYLASELTKYGHQCSQVFTLNEALTFVSSEDYDVIILDLNLPDGEGDILVEEMHRHTAIPIVVLTGSNDRQRREDLFRLGIVDYWHKENLGGGLVQSLNGLMERLLHNAEATILVIEDSMMVRRHMQALLAPRRYRILLAATGGEGLELLRSQKVSLVITDMELPDIHGLEILAKIKALPRLALLPVIVLSGSSDADIVSRSYKLGAADFIRKPYVAEEILLKVDFWVDYYRQNREIAQTYHIANEYKAAIDRSTIVSKTDPDGIITYANQKFCDISGYTQEELIGHPHNIVRHPQMPKEVFEEMWSTIKAGKPWRGIIKNRAKDGHTYIVDTTINPIVDNEGKIIEFIGIRTDITEIEMLRQKLASELEFTREGYKESVARTKEI